MKFFRDYDVPVLLLVAVFSAFLGVSIYSYEDIVNYQDNLPSTTADFTTSIKDAAINSLIIGFTNKPEVLATNTYSKATVNASQDAGAPLSLPTPVVTPVVSPVYETAIGPYSLNSDASTQLADLGYVLPTLQSEGIQVIGHSGAVPRRCATGTSGGLYAQGMAIRTEATYPTCPDGGPPLYDAYRPAGYSCTIIYNSRSSKSSAILAHEIGHCLHFTNGEYRVFDVNYRIIRPDASKLSRSKMNEIVADDFMICKQGLDTNFGASSYYSRYGIDRPTTTQCSEINSIITTYLF